MLHGSKEGSIAKSVSLLIYLSISIHCCCAGKEVLGGEVNPEALKGLQLATFSHPDSPSEGEVTARDREVSRLPTPKPGKKEESSPEAPFVLSKTLPVVPTKLVR